MGRPILFRKSSGPRPKPILTNRQKQAGELLVLGLKNRDIAASMGITEGSVKVLVSQTYKRVGVATRQAFARWWEDCFPHTSEVLTPVCAGDPRMGVFE